MDCKKFLDRREFPVPNGRGLAYGVTDIIDGLSRMSHVGPSTRRMSDV